MKKYLWLVFALLAPFTAFSNEVFVDEWQKQCEEFVENYKNDDVFKTRIEGIDCDTVLLNNFIQILESEQEKIKKETEKEIAVNIDSTVSPPTQAGAEPKVSELEKSIKFIEDLRPIITNFAFNELLLIVQESQKYKERFASLESMPIDQAKQEFIKILTELGKPSAAAQPVTSINGQN